MKQIVTLFIGIILFSCGTKKQSSELKFKCPEEGVCKTEKHESKSLVVKKDDIGAFYYQLEENKTKITFVYRYEQNQDQAYVDGHYNEEIIFEIDNSVFEKDFENLKPQKILFGVFCYCKGKAGYYEVSDAKISYDKKTKNLTISIDEVVDGQILKVVQFSVE